MPIPHIYPRFALVPPTVPSIRGTSPPICSISAGQNLTGLRPLCGKKGYAMAEKSQALKRLPDVLNRVGYSRSTIYQLIADGKFPKPVSLGARAVAWLESDIDAWIAARIEGLTYGAH